MPRPRSVQPLADSGRELRMLEQLRELLRDGSPLDGDEKQLLMYLLWLLRPADELKRQKAMNRLVKTIRRNGMDRSRFTSQLKRAITEFEPVET